MEVFLQILANSIITGSIYGVMAMSFTLAYRTTRFFNLAHGGIAAVGGYMYVLLNHKMGIPFIAAIPFAILLAGLTGFLIDRFIYAPQRRRKASGSVLLVMSLGVVTVIEALLAIFFTVQFQPLTNVHDIQIYYLFGASLTRTQILMVLFNFIAFGGLLLMLYKTKFGRMLRAISDDPEVARILGIRINLYIGWMFFVSAAVAGVMGILVGFDTGLQPTVGFYLLLKGVIAAIIGCVTSIPGAFVGGYVLALAENFGIWKLSSEWRDAIAFVLLLLFLVFRPQGILGKGQE